MGLGSFLDYTINGLVIGNVYALLAVGLALIFGGLHTLEEMGHDYRAAFWGQAEHVRVGYLAREDAWRLITQPHPDFALQYTPRLRDEIYRRGAEGWHTDGAYNQAPFKATQLYALAVPSRGGNTLFANGYAAYDALPQRLKERLDGVIGAFSYGGRSGKARLLNPEDQDWTPVVHPIVRTHPETGRKSLYFDPGKIVSLVGIEDHEGDELIAELKGRMITPAAEYHHVWRKGDIVIWDNRCSYHKAAGDYPPEEDRIHWRVSINDFGVEALEAAE